MLFTGEYEHTIDTKHRLAVPAEVRASMDRKGLDPVFYVVPGPRGSLWLWPEETFESMAGAFEQTLVPGDDMMDFFEITFPLARRVEVDGAGRIRLAADQLRDAGLGPGVAILGMGDHLELRDPQAWATEREEKRQRQSEIMLRARQAMRDRTRRDGGGDAGS